MTKLRLVRNDSRLEIHTDFGIVGNRLTRGEPLPRYEASYPDTPDGWAKASADMAEIEKYIRKHNERKIKHLRRKQPYNTIQDK